MVIETTSVLTNGGLVIPYGDKYQGQHWFRWWLVAWRHQAITWTNVDLSSVRFSGIHLRAISQEIPQPSITKIHLKITYSKFHSNFPGANELSNGSLVLPYGHLGQHWPSQWLVVWVAWQHQAISETNVNFSSKVIIGHSPKSNFTSVHKLNP